MEECISFHLGGSPAVIEAAVGGGFVGHWNSQAFIGANSAAVAFLIIARHKARLSARMAADA